MGAVVKETTGDRVFRFFLSLVLMTLGVLFTLYGMQTLRDGRVEWDMGRDRHGDLMEQHEYSGAEARWFALSWIAFGAFWALSASSLMGVRRPTRLTRATSVVALVCLAFAVVWWFPPLHSEMTVCIWATLAANGAILACLKPGQRAVGCFGLALLALVAVLALGFAQRIYGIVGVMFGMFFAAAASAHLYLLLRKT